MQNKDRIDSIQDEIIWRERKRRQVIVTGVKESKATAQAERAAEDNATLADVMSATKSGINKDEIKFARRVGKADGTKDRPLCVGFYDEYTKDRLLRFAKNLKGTEHKDIKIMADLTRAQRESFKKQLDMAKAKNATKEDLDADQEWRVVGPRGDTRLIRVKVQQR